MDLEKIKQERDCWDHCDAFNAHWYDYIKLDMVDYLISETEQLRKEKEYWKRKLRYEYMRYEQGDEWVNEMMSDHEKEMHQALKKKKNE